MKKFLTFILVCVLTSVSSFAKDTSATEILTNSVSTVYEDGKEATGTLYNDAKEVIKYITPKVEAAVQAIGESLKVGTNEVFIILCQQQYVKAMNECIPLAICIFLIILVIVMSSKGLLFSVFEDKNVGDDSGTAKTVLSFIGGIIACILVIVSFCLVDFETMFTGFFNPKYGAIQDIINIASTFIN